MKYKREATGKELIPNVEFWSSLPGLVKVSKKCIIKEIAIYIYLRECHWSLIFTQRYQGLIK